MGMAHRAPKGRMILHVIDNHAIERLREYGTDIARAANNQALEGVLDEALLEGIEYKEDFITSDGNDRFFVPFVKERWAAPGLWLLCSYLEKSQYKVETIYTTTAKESDLARKKSIPAPPPPADLQRQLAEAQGHIKRLQGDMEYTENVKKDALETIDALEQALTQARDEAAALKAFYEKELAALRAAAAKPVTHPVDAGELEICKNTIKNLEDRNRKLYDDNCDLTGRLEQAELMFEIAMRNLGRGLRGA